LGGRADDERRGGGPADAGRSSDRRRATPGNPRQRAAQRSRVLCRPEGGRVSDRSLLALTLSEARDGLARRSFSARELTAAYNDPVNEIEPLNAFITPTPERALEMAEAADQRLARGNALPLDGIPIAVKDLYCTKGVLTTAASHILDGFHPPYESTVTDRLWQSGAVMLGKTNLDEFAMGSSNTTSCYGPVESPWRQPGDNRPLVPGGSSGGSAAAVAARAAVAPTGPPTRRAAPPA